MTIEKKVTGNTVELSLNGWMDTQSAPVLAEALSRLGPETEKLVLDLSGLEYTSSAGIRQIVLAHKQMKGAVVLRNVSGNLLEILRIMGLEKRLNIELHSPAIRKAPEMKCEYQMLPARLDAFNTVRDNVIARAGDTPQTRQALLACDEWIANVVSHSGASRIGFGCALEEGYLQVEFSDDGVPFDPIPENTELPDFDMLDQGGMGLTLIRQTACRMDYERANGENHLRLWFSMGSDCHGEDFRA